VDVSASPEEAKSLIRRSRSFFFLSHYFAQMIPLLSFIFQLNNDTESLVIDDNFAEMPSYGSLKERHEKEVTFSFESDIRTSSRLSNEPGKILWPTARSPALQKVAIITVMLLIISIIPTFKDHMTIKRDEQSSVDRVYFKKLNERTKAQIFEAFLLNYDKYYPDPVEYASRYQVFKGNLDLCDERNSAEELASGAAVHGITMFSDITSEEFSKIYLMSFTSDDGYSTTAIASVELPNNYADESKAFVADILSEVGVDWTAG
jgi:hypothetical protein